MPLTIYNRIDSEKLRQSKIKQNKTKFVFDLVCTELARSNIIMVQCTPEGMRISLHNTYINLKISQTKWIF